MQENTNTPSFEHLLSASVNDMKNSLSMVLQTLDGLPAEHQQTLGTVQYEATRMQNTLTQLLGLYLIERGTLPVQMSEHYLIDIVEECVIAQRSLLESKGIQVELDVDDISWYMDAQLISSVVNIALVNAVRYTKSQISISAGMSDGYLYLHVDDNGQGYPPIVLEKFQQLVSDQAALDASSQTLGWYYCERVAAIHCNQGRKGSTRLSNESQQGGGRLSIILP